MIWGIFPGFRHIRILLILALVCLCASCRSGINLEDASEISRPAEIRPDYSGIIIPPNIAPLNFAVMEAGQDFFVRIRSAKGKSIDIKSSSSNIVIPIKSWRRLLADNHGQALFFDIFVRVRDSKWQRYQSLSNTIAAENIDGYLAYRLMKPIYSYWKNIGIHQRNLENYQESVILHGSSFGSACVNCHTFVNNRPERMFIGVRSMDYGAFTLLADRNEVVKIGAKWGYTSWHPSGRYVAYPVMNVIQFFHAAGMEIRDVIDLDSVMLYYDIPEKKVKTNLGFSEKERLETYPTWTPDGRTMYFCSAAIPWKDRTQIPPENFDKVKYDLRRISFDPDTDKWGEMNTILSSEETGLSILEPRISPDGRFLLFCMCEYGCFPVFQPSSDLYLMDLQTGEYRKLDINSPFSESWHSWSSNGRWIVFSSKRLGGLFTRPFISSINTAGEVSKPFILPQKDPRFYARFLKTFSVPEFITGPVTVSQRALLSAIRSPRKIIVDTFTGATPQGPKSKAPIRE